MKNPEFSAQDSSDSVLSFDFWLKSLFSLLIFSLAFLQPAIFFYGYRVPYTDFIFLAVFGLWVVSLALGKTRFRFDKFFFLLLFYLAAMTVSLATAPVSVKNYAKLAGEIYLLALPVLTFNLIRTESDLKRVFYAWLAGTGVCLAVGFLTIFLFYFDRENSLLVYTNYYFGAVPVGNYPRVNSTFNTPSMLCNYLTVGLSMVFLGEKRNWLSVYAFHFFYFSILLIAVFTISSSLGGILFSLGIWFWLLFIRRRTFFARLCLIGGAAAAVLFFFINFVALEYHQTAPYGFTLPILEKTVYPSPRFMIWSESLNTFVQNFWFGAGLGNDPCRVKFQNTDGSFAILNDAHNVFLSIAAQTGIFGLSAIAAIIAYLIYKIFPLKFTGKQADVFRLSFGLAFFSAFVCQGLVGSFEDARHLWILIGLLLVSLDLSQRPQ